MKVFSSQKGMSTPITVLIVVVALIVVGFLYFNYRDDGYRMGDSLNGEGRVESDGEAMSSDDRVVGDNAMEKNGVMAKDEILALLLNDSSTQAALLSAVDESDSSGTAYRLVRDGKLYHGVIATMADPQEGHVYEGWLVQASPLKFFSTGIMRNPESKVWVLEYTADNEYPTYLRTVITEEAIVDATPERHIIEGDF